MQSAVKKNVGFLMVHHNVIADVCLRNCWCSPRIVGARKSAYLDL